MGCEETTLPDSPFALVEMVREHDADIKDLKAWRAEHQVGDRNLTICLGAHLEVNRKLLCEFTRLRELVERGARAL